MKRVVKEVPFSENVVKLIYDDGTFGLRSTVESKEEIPETAIDDEPATQNQMSEMIQESNPLMKKYADQLRTKFNVVDDMPKKKRN